MDIKYQEVKLQEVINQFAQGFEPPEGTTIMRAENFVDAQKGVVIFKLYIQDS